MIIDFHTHVFPDKIAEKTITLLSKNANIPAYRNGSVDSLKQSMDKAGIDYAVTLPAVTKPSQVESINRFAAELNKDEKLISFGGMHPMYEDYKNGLQFIKDSGLKGVKFHPDYQGYFIDDEDVYPVFEYAASLGLIIVFHAGRDLGFPGQEIRCTPKRARRLIDKLGYDKLVFAHTGGYDCWEDVYTYLAGQDIYLDTSFSLGKIQDELFLKILEKHGAEKFLFATDSPWDDQAEDVERLKGLGLPALVQEDIFSGNALKLLGGDVK